MWLMEYFITISEIAPDTVSFSNLIAEMTCTYSGSKGKKTCCCGNFAAYAVHF